MILTLTSALFVASAPATTGLRGLQIDQPSNPWGSAPVSDLPSDSWGSASPDELPAASGDPWGPEIDAVADPTGDAEDPQAKGWVDYFYGCRMGDIRYGSRWWNWWKPEGCTCWESRWEQNTQTGDARYTGRSCDRTPNGLKVHDSYYDGGENGYYLVEIPSHLLAQEMLKEVMALPIQDRPAYWRSRNIPENMRGLWWTDYNRGVTSFLHNQPATTDAAGKLVTDTVVYGSNVWAWSTTTLYTVVDLLNLNYLFKFEDRDGSGDGVVDFADIIPQFTSGVPTRGIDVSQWLTAFTMAAETHCANCRAPDAANNPNAGTAGHTPIATAQLSAAQKDAQVCRDSDSSAAGGGVTPGSQQCWRRYTSVGGPDRPSVWDYDLIKIVDQWGQPVEPGFSNWVAAVRAEDRGDGLGGSDKVLLARCMPGNANCQGDNQPGAVGVQGMGGSRGRRLTSGFSLDEPVTFANRIHRLIKRPQHRRR